ncbi:MAG TPA: GyrI-like domain-containing protein [Candidatus Limnocylindria bacterium]|nr:GyrI-like domain-containing protein [Candidatus Limnocylindria bacterium]
MPVDFKKTDKRLYAPGAKPDIVDVPEMAFLMADGRGDPNGSVAYAQAVEALYSLSYAIKMGFKQGALPDGWFEYVVPPLEGLWRLDDGGAFLGGGAPVADKGLFVWTMMVRQPDFVTPEVVEDARARLARKKALPAMGAVRLERFAEGLCAQVMHVGPYDAEPATVAALSRFIRASGHMEDFTGARRHHEIDLSDPRKAAPEAMRTVIRHPVRKV